MYVPNAKVYSKDKSETSILKSVHPLVIYCTARSLVFSPILHIDRSVNKAVRVISISNRLKTLVVTEGALTASQMKSIMKAASQRNNLEIIVPASSYANWTSILNNQKFKLGQATISCADVSSSDTQLLM